MLQSAGKNGCSLQIAEKKLAGLQIKKQFKNEINHL